MKYLILVFIFASGLYAQESDKFEIQKYAMKYSKEIECVKKNLEDPSMETKLQKTMSEMMDFQKEYMEMVMETMMQNKKCSDCMDKICVRASNVVNQFIVDSKDDIKTCFTNPESIDILAKYIVEISKYTCTLEDLTVEEISRLMQDDCKKFDDSCLNLIDTDAVLNNFCSADFSKFFDCVRKPLSVCVDKNHGLLKLVDFTSNFVDRECAVDGSAFKPMSWKPLMFILNGILAAFIIY